MLAWLRALADPNDSGAVVRALSRPPVELRSVDVARLTQLARRRKLDMPSAVAAALEGPQLSEEGRDRARAFLRLYRSASNAFEDRRPDAFVLRLIERIGLRRRQVFATHADTVERLRNIAKLPELATAYMRREPHATARDFTRYLAAVAESGLREEEATGTPDGARHSGDEHGAAGARVRPRLRARPVGRPHAGYVSPEADVIPSELLKGRRPALDGREAHEAEMRRLLHLAITRARKGLVLAWAESGAPGTTPRPSPFYEEAMAASGWRRRSWRRSCSARLRGSTPPSGSCATSCSTPSRAWAGDSARCGSTPTSTSTRPSPDTSSSIKVAALIERAKEGQDLDAALPAVNEILSPVRNAGAARDARAVRRSTAGCATPSATPPSGPRATRTAPSLRSTRSSHAAVAGLMLSASDIDTYRICPLKYESRACSGSRRSPPSTSASGLWCTRCWSASMDRGGGSLAHLMELFEASWRRSGFGDSDDEQQFRKRAVVALESYWQRDRDSDIGEAGRPQLRRVRAEDWLDAAKPPGWTLPGMRPPHAGRVLHGRRAGTCAGGGPGGTPGRAGAPRPLLAHGGPPGRTPANCALRHAHVPAVRQTGLQQSGNATEVSRDGAWG